MKAEDLMDEPDFIEPDAAIEEVVEEFKGSENTLIVREENKIMGEIHENSLLKAMIPEDKLDEESIIGVLGISFDQSYVPDTAEDLMNSHEVTISPDTDIGEIAFLMDREDIRSLPVKEDGEIIGVVHENKVIENFSEGGE
ncbi:CBS domain-containing protein [Candidatus Nanohalovita haloferacivicina]|uniref:CBS domain-containing protein n=1 Tax=Candidatus Nanohalovita haloferacivicina TaxID=2978046 RepID=UPI00325FB892